MLLEAIFKIYKYRKKSLFHEKENARLEQRKKSEKLN